MYSYISFINNDAGLLWHQYLYFIDNQESIGREINLGRSEDALRSLVLYTQVSEMELLYKAWVVVKAQRFIKKTRQHSWPVSAFLNQQRVACVIEPQKKRIDQCVCISASLNFYIMQSDMHTVERRSSTAAGGAAITDAFLFVSNLMTSTKFTGISFI